MSEPGRIEEAGATIAYRTVKGGSNTFNAPWSLTLDTVTAHRLEVVETGGRVLFRHTEVEAAPLRMPLQIGVGAGLLTTVTYVGWARGRIGHATLGPNARDVLPAVLGDAGRTPDVAR